MALIGCPILFTLCQSRGSPRSSVAVGPPCSSSTTASTAETQAPLMPSVTWS